MNRVRLQRFLSRNSYLFALLLLVIALGINYYLQDNLFEMRVLNRNLRVFLPLMILAVGQAIVIIGGGIDLSVGAMVSMCNAIIATRITSDSAAVEIIGAILLACGAGVLAGALNGFSVAYLRLQPIVTTYATSFIYSGLALLILPRPGGDIPRHMTDFYRSTPANIPIAVYAAVIILLLWYVLRSTRYGQYLYATGDNTTAAYTTGVPVGTVKFSTYVASGFIAAISALALTLSLGSGSPRIGDNMTLESIVAVVLGGTRLSGGQGGIAGALIGVVILGIIRNIISFANVPTWSQTLVDALIIVSALAAPGLVRLISTQVNRFRVNNRQEEYA
ncbi:MAG: hypothetical protein OHK0046_33400 [Anaerolineae bacterium]